MDCLESAIQAYLNENYVDITDYNEELKDENDPLELCIKKDLYDKLSKDAKKVIDLVLTTSLETFSTVKSLNNKQYHYISKKKNYPTIKLVEYYLRWAWNWNWHRIGRTIKEIKLFLNSL